MCCDKYAPQFQQAFANAHSFPVGNDDARIEPQRLLSSSAHELARSKTS